MNSEKIVNEFGLNIREIRIGLSKICSRNFGRNFLCIKEIDGNEVTFMLWNGVEEDSIKEITFTVNPHDFYATFCSVLEKEFPEVSKFKKKAKYLQDELNEKDEKIEELINMCDYKDEEIKRLTLISDESLKDKIHAERTGRQLDVFRAKVECAAEILNNLI